MNEIIKTLLYEKSNKIKKRLYEYVVVKMTYESNKIEGSTLTLNETSELYNRNEITIINRNSIKLDELVESKNHFKAINFILDNWNKTLSEDFIKKIHLILFKNTHTNDENFNVGNYKKYANTIGSIIETTLPKDVGKEMKNLLSKYSEKRDKKIENIIDFHYNFEKIHPFQDGNGRVGRLVMFKECLKENIVPFIILEEEKAFYIRGLSEYENEKGFLIDSCLHFQDQFKEKLEYFGVEVKEYKR